MHVTPAARTFSSYESTSSRFMFNGYNALVLGTQLQVGSGSTAPARNNTNIQTAFGTAPESGRFGTGSGSYAAGVVSLAGAITAGGAGTVAESGFFGAWGDDTLTTSVLRYVMLFHDLISPTVAFVAGNILTLSYTITL